MISAFIEGIRPVLPVLLLLLLGGISLAVAWWTYRHLESISSLKKNGLILLRGATFLILILLLLNPYIFVEEIISERPAIAVYLDDSQSVSVERGNYNGLETYIEQVEQFQSEQSPDIQYDFFFFDENIHEADPIEITASGLRTNINNVVEHVRENENRYRAAVIFSDGIVTRGRNPLFAAQNLSVPLFIVPVGDTTQVRDIALAGVDYVQQVSVFTRQTIRVEVQQQGFEGEETNVRLIRQGEILDTESLVFTSETGSRMVEFTEEFEEPGFYDYEIHIPPKEDEFTDQNNRAAFTIEVRDDKTRVLSLAFEVHPDVGTIRRLLATDQQVEMIQSTALGNNRFAGKDPRQIEEEIDVIVLHGLPPVNSGLFQWLNQHTAPIVFWGVPTAYEHLQSRDAGDLTGFYGESLDEVIPIQLESFSAEDISHPILEISPVHVQQFPNLQTYRGDYSLTPTATPLTHALFQRNATDIPLLVAEDLSTRRKVSVNAFGWYRFAQHRQEEVRNFFTHLFTNLLSWTSTPPDRQTLTLEPEKPVFTENEPLRIRAHLFNESGEPEPEGLIELQIYSGDEDQPLNTFRMNHQRDEVYEAELGNYPRGIYRLHAEATKNNRTIGTAEGRVEVDRSNIEYLQTKRNDEILKGLADITGGIFLEDSDFSRVRAMTEQLLTEDPVQETRRDFFHLYHSGFWFLVILGLLSAEWLIRRSVSLP